MTTLTPTRSHRLAFTPAPRRVYAIQAAEIRRRLDRDGSVTVEVSGRGPGWYVIDIGDGLYRVRRGGVELAVAWSDVLLGSV